MYCPACGAELDGAANYCSRCGTAIDAGGTVESGEENDFEPASADDRRDQSGDRVDATPRASPAPPSPGTVPPEAAAIDITCQHCGSRPIEELATGHRITAFVVAYHQATYQLIGCHPCVRRKLWWMAAKNLVLGWWGLKAAAWNAVLTAKNLGRGALRRGPNEALVDTLASVGVIYDYLDDPSAFDPERHSPMELYVRSFVRLGTAVMLADEDAHPDERAAIKAGIRELAPGYPPGKLDALIERASQSPVDVEEVTAGIETLLSPAGEERLVEFVAAVAEAGVADEAAIALAATVVRALDMDERDVDAILGQGGSASPATA